MGVRYKNAQGVPGSHMPSCRCHRNLNLLPLGRFRVACAGPCFTGAGIRWVLMMWRYVEKFVVVVVVVVYTATRHCHDVRVLRLYCCHYCLSVMLH